MSKLISRRVRFRRLREIALLLEKFAIFAAIALLTYALIVLDTRAAIPDAATSAKGVGPISSVYGWLVTATQRASSGETPRSPQTGATVTAR